MQEKVGLVSGYEQHVRVVRDWTLEIILYCLTDKYICIVNNTDPKATLCRVTAAKRDDALRKGLLEASTRVSETVFTDLPFLDLQPDRQQTLGRLVFDDPEQPADLAVGEFLSLPISTRMQMILSGKLVYYDTENRPVGVAAALKLLGKANSATPATAAAQVPEVAVASSA